MIAPASNVLDVICLYLTHTQKEQAARTYEGRRRVLTAFGIAHGEIPIAEAKPFHLRLWVDSRDEWKSDWTKKAVIGAVQRAFNWAAKLGIIDRNPFVGVSQREGPPGRPMTDDEFRRLLRASSCPFRRVLLFLRYTGCRPGELAGIEPAHVDLDRGIVVMAAHKTAKTRRDKKPRVIVLHPVAAGLLRVLMRQMMPGQQTVFINQRGNAWNRYALACRMKQLRKRLRLAADVRLYSLRYGFASSALHRHLDLKTLSVLLGHSTVATTQRYCRIDGDLDHLAASVRQVFNGVHSKKDA